MKNYISWGGKVAMKPHYIKIIGIIVSVLLVYLLIALYFRNHFFFQTNLNGVKLSLNAHKDADSTIKRHVLNYELTLGERNGDIEIITAQDIGLIYNEDNQYKLCRVQKSLLWIFSLFKAQNCYINDLYSFDEDKFEDTVSNLMCMNRDRIYPKNVSFHFKDGAYHIDDEVDGNVMILDRLKEEIKLAVLYGKQSLDLERAQCYASPRYTRSSDKMQETKELLDQYIASTVIYQFGYEQEILDGSTIHKWLIVNEELDVIINQTAVKNYIKRMSKKYDTVGIAREFKTSTGNQIVVEGGLYGWKIDQEEEINLLIENIKQGKLIEREPAYSQKALYREKDELGATYVEINITKQYLWYYKDGVIIAQGPVVTGNPNRGYATVVGIYMLNYKETGAILQGPGYEAQVNYWMPFYGGQGIHDALWRYSFGGEIYKRRGSHGCVNAPYSLAKKIYENIEAGVPIIIYEE